MHKFFENTFPNSKRFFFSGNDEKGVQLGNSTHQTEHEFKQKKKRKKARIIFTKKKEDEHKGKKRGEVPPA